MVTVLLASESGLSIFYQQLPNEGTGMKLPGEVAWGVVTPVALCHPQHHGLNCDPQSSVDTLALNPCEGGLVGKNGSCRCK